MTSDQPTYEIRVRGRLGSSWAAWFDGLDITDAGDGTSVISGVVVDQSALHGLLRKLSDLGLVLESLAHVSPDPAVGGTHDLTPTSNDTSGAPS